MSANLTAYVPRLLLEWEASQPDVRYRSIDGTLVFADVSGFTKLSERLARAGGKIGAEQMTDVINALFGELLLVAAARGGEMLKYGGDAVLLFFMGEEHAARGVAACVEMQRKLKEIGRVDTGAGIVRLRMSVGVNTGDFDFFKVGRSHEELVVAGPATTTCVEMESAADATEILVSPSTAAMLDPGVLGQPKAGGRLIRRLPKAPLVDFAPFATDVDVTKFVPVALRDQLSSDAVDPVHRLATVAFLHVMDMDRELATAGPEDVVLRLDETLGLIQDAFADFGVSFLATDLAPDGTKVMAASGAPVSHPDAEERMLRALVPLVTGTTPLPIRAGVNRGHVFAGDVGPPFRRTYTTIGDVTNTAARVMGRAARGECLALGPVLTAATSQWATEELEPFLAKGKVEPLRPFSVKGRIDAAHPDRAATTVVGRERELEILQDRWRRTLDGGGGSLTLEGEAGVGKSTLLDQLVASVSDAVVVRSECSPYDAATPYRSAQAVLVAATGGPGLEELVGAVERHAPDLRPWLPLLALPLGTFLPDTPEVAALDPARRTERLHDATVALLDAAIASPLLVVIESAEHADEAGRAMLDAIAKAASDRRWLVVRSRRPVGESSAAEADEVLVVEPLSERAALDLVRRLAPSAVLPDTARRLVARAGGNPLFLSTLVRSEGSEVPETVEALFAGEIDRLPSSHRRLLRAAAVVGPSFDAAALAAVVDDDASASPHDADLLPFLESEGATFRFRHRLVRDVAYEGLPFRLRRELHRRLGEWMASADEPEPELVAVHFDASGDAEQTWEWSLRAAERAERSMAHETAATFFARAADAGRRTGSVDAVTLGCVHRALGEASVFAGKLDDAARAYARARRLLRKEPAPLAEVHLLEGVLREHRGDRSGALRWFGSVVQILDRCDCWWDRPGFLPNRFDDAERLRIRALLGRGLNRYRARRLPGARRDAEEALRRARACGDLGGQAHALALLHLVCTDLRLPQPEPYAEEAVELFERLGDHKELANILNNLGMARHLDGDWDAASAYYEQSQAAQAAAGHVVNGAAVANNRAEILIDQGRLEVAEPLLLDAVQTFDAAGHWFSIIALLNLATLSARARRFDEAFERADRAIERAQQLGAAAFVADGTARRAEVALLAGQPEEATAALASVDAARSSMRGRRVLAIVAASRGARDTALEELRALAVEAREGGERFEELLALDAVLLLDPAAESAADVRSRVDHLVALLGIVDLAGARPDHLTAEGAHA